MIGHTEEFASASRTSQTRKGMFEVVRDGAVIRTLDAHDGRVDADRTNRILRRFTAKVADPTGELTPEGIRDLLAPFGTEVRGYSGVLIPEIQTLIDTDDTAAQFAEGTRVGTVADAAGDLVLGNT